MIRPRSKLACAFGVALALTALTAPPADARRGGSFGSRGMRTYQAPPRTQTAPQQTAPIQRSMNPAPRPAAQQPAPRPAGAAAAAPARRGGMFGGFGGGLMGGLLAGGLIGALMGNGFGAGWGGAMGGFLTMLIQAAAIGLGIWLLMKLFRRRQSQPAMAGAGAGVGPTMAPTGFGRMAQEEPVAPAYTPYAATASAGGGEPSLEIPITPGDRETFERLLVEVQDAFGREDYGALRNLTTPEIMSFLAEELSENAVAGRRNEVTGTRLLEADVAQAWREGDTDYATAAIRYESTDVMRDRNSGAVLEGSSDRPTETTELWTFARREGEWRLSAIQVA